MKSLQTLVLALALGLGFVVLAPTRAVASAGLESEPGYLPIDKAIDLKTLVPEVNINLPRFLLMDAASELSGGTNDPFAAAGVSLADLVKDVKLVRVVVIEADDKTNRAALDKGMAALRAQLESRWTPLATVPEENVGVYVLGDANGESMAGLAILVNDDGDAVIANVVGRVSIGKLVKAASRFDQFPKELLKKLTGTVTEAGEGAPAPTTAKSAK